MIQNAILINMHVTIKADKLRGVVFFIFSLMKLGNFITCYICVFALEYLV